jgi:uncharacterized membrane protein HdeD (DUF308 family)
MSTPQFNGPLSPFFSAIKTVHDHWQWFLFSGIALIILGIFAVGAATLTSFVTIFFLGALLLIGGITKLIYAFWARKWTGFFLTLLVGILYVVTGFLCLTKPVAALAALTLVIGSLFVVTGIFKIVASVVARFEQWGWILFSGIVSLILGIIVLTEWPLASLWVIGLFVGIDLIVYGWTWVLLALGARRIRRV